MKTLRVRNQAQKVLWESELSGQISDGMWENAYPMDHWQDWSDVTVVVDPNSVGRDFYARKTNYLFTSSELLDIVGERMIAAVRGQSGSAGLQFANYDMRALRADLRDLRKIIKTVSFPSSNAPAPGAVAQEFAQQAPPPVSVLREQAAAASARVLEQQEQSVAERTARVNHLQTELNQTILRLAGLNTELNLARQNLAAAESTLSTLRAAAAG